MTNKKRKDIIVDILKSHRGRGNPITANEISRLIGVSEDDTHQTTRAYIRSYIKSEELPVGANSTGFYWITNQEEFDDYIQNLKQRISGIQHRIDVVTKNYNNKENK